MVGCDLVFYVFEAEDTLNLRCEYDAALFVSDFIEGMLEKYRMLLKSMLKEQGRRVFELPLLSEAERHQLLETWNATQSDYSPKTNSSINFLKIRYGLHRMRLRWFFLTSISDIANSTAAQIKSPTICWHWALVQARLWASILNAHRKW